MGSTTLRVWRLAVFLALTLTLMPVQAAGIVLRRRWVAEFPRFYHRNVCRLLGLKVSQIGHPVSARPVLFVSNHLGYIDITVLGSLIPGSFVAKSEVAGWPLVGWLAKLQRSVFVDRQVRTTAQQRDAIAERLAAKDALILFPEGTSGDGNHVLPFKSSLFSVVFNKPTDEPITVQPVSVAYTRLDGLPIGRRLRPFFAWYGDMNLGPHAWNVLGLGTVEIEVEFHPPTTVGEWVSRKELSQFCYDRISNGVGRLLSGRGEAPAPTVRPQREPVASDFPAAAVS
jgi:1-acyl-sn-glycerol-3-phosphate acyltransferase